MNIDTNALWFLLLGSAIIGAANMLIKRLGTIETTLDSHGRKLVRIEERLKIPDHDTA